MYCVYFNCAVHGGLLSSQRASDLKLRKLSHGTILNDILDNKRELVLF